MLFFLWDFFRCCCLIKSNEMKEASKGKDIAKDVIRLITLDNDNSFFFLLFLWSLSVNTKMNHTHISVYIYVSGVHKSN